MRRMILCIMAALILLLPATHGIAEGQVYSVPELNVKLTVPSAYFVLTRDMLAGEDPAVAQVLSEFEAGGIYLFASFDLESEEINLTTTHVGPLDFSKMTEQQANAFYGQISDAMLAEGFSLGGYELVTLSGKTFFKLKLSSYDDTVHGITYCTTHDGDAFYLTLRSYTGSISSRQENDLLQMADSLQFTSPSSQQNDLIFAPAAVYTDPDTGLSITIHNDWKEDSVSASRKYLDVKFLPKAGGMNMIAYGSTDLWEQFPLGSSRSEMDHSFLSKDFFAEAYSLPVSKIKSVTYNGVPYYWMEYEFSSQAISMKLTQVVHLRNGWLHSFQFLGDEENPLYPDFEWMLNRVKYPDE